MQEDTTRKEEYPFYPLLADPGAKEAVELIEDFKKKLVSAAEEAISNLYCDIVPHIESDSWMNYRNDLMSGFRNYGNRKIQGQHDFKAIRAQIYIEFRDDIIADLNQDHLEKIKELEKSLEWEIKLRRR